MIQISNWLGSVGAPKMGAFDFNQPMGTGGFPAGDGAQLGPGSHEAYGPGGGGRVASMVRGLKSGPPASSAKQNGTPHIKNRTDFAKALLSKLKAPNTKANVSSIDDWERLEGGNWDNTARYNPLDTTESEPGATDMNSAGVKAYQNWTQGIDATAQTLLSPTNPDHGDYQQVVNALRSGGGLENNSYAGLSDWSGGAYSSV
jgi:hypothetical protein